MGAVVSEEIKDDHTNSSSEFDLASDVKISEPILPTKSVVFAKEMSLKEFSLTNKDSLELLLPYLDYGMLFGLAAAYPEFSDMFITSFLQFEGKSLYEGASYRSAASYSGVFGSFRQDWGDQTNRCVDSKMKPEYKLLKQYTNLRKMTNSLNREVFLARQKPKPVVLDPESELDDKPEIAHSDGVDEFDEPKKVLSKAWGKGVGYGSEWTNDQESWDISTWQRECEKNESSISKAFDVIRKTSLSNEWSQKVLPQSCLIPALIGFCQNDSFQEINSKFKLYYSIFKLIKKLLRIPEFLPLIFEGENDSIANSICKLGIQAEAMQALKSKLSNEQDDDKDLGVILVGLFNEVKKSLNLCISMLSVAQSIAGDSSDLSLLLEKLRSRQKSLDDMAAPLPMKKDVSFEAEYEAFARESCFDSVEEVSDFPGHYFLNYDKNPVSRKLMKRLATEYADLPSSLPIHYESSVFFRFCEERMNVCQMLVVPPDGTPYGGGCFIFDILFPSNYPRVPPKVNLATTGGGSVRFNPNLYESGYVCLSLLGTWDAYSQGEEWNPTLSTLLQVIISVQSLIFVPEPYYNEPGYESEMGTEWGDKKSRDYNTIIENGTWQWAMIDMLENPPKAWKDVIQSHFRMQGDRVLANAKKWFGADSTKVTKLQGLLADLHSGSESEASNIGKAGA